MRFSYAVRGAAHSDRRCRSRGRRDRPLILCGEKDSCSFLDLQIKPRRTRGDGEAAICNAKRDFPVPPSPPNRVTFRLGMRSSLSHRSTVFLGRRIRRLGRIEEGPVLIVRCRHVRRRHVIWLIEIVVNGRPLSQSAETMNRRRPPPLEQLDRFRRLYNGLPRQRGALVSKVRGSLCAYLAFSVGGRLSRPLARRFQFAVLSPRGKWLDLPT